MRVLAASGGNHGIAVATAAHQLGMTADIFVPESVPAAKRERLTALGARVHAQGAEYALAYEACIAHREQHGGLLCHAFDSADTVIGQGTVALEWAAQSPGLDTWLVAVGGGGLIGGICAWAMGSPRVVAVETAGCATLERALAAGEPVDVPVSGIAADALGARRIGSIAFPIVQRHLARACLVDDSAVLEARRFAGRRCASCSSPAAPRRWPPCCLVPTGPNRTSAWACCCAAPTQRSARHEPGRPPPATRHPLFADHTPHGRARLNKCHRSSRVGHLRDRSRHIKTTVRQLASTASPGFWGIVLPCLT
ncbi:MAG: pyridoxal-phosphate dependent enzyme [Burkholderiaceae bacterium]